MRSIRFEGNGGGLGGTGDFQLRGAMEQKRSPRFSWLAPRRMRVLLDPDALALDAWRIETWYAHHGFFDARFAGWDVRTVRRETERRPPVVAVTGRVEPGPPTLVTSLVWENLGPIKGGILGMLRAQAAVQEGARFDLDAVEETAAQTLEVLQNHGYARAAVEPVVDVFADEHEARVRLVGDLGEVCRFGEVTLEGRFSVSEKLIREKVTVEPGRKYEAAELVQTQRRLFALGIFSVVNVVPDLDESNGDEIPVRIELSESRYRQLRLGGGFEVEGDRADAHLSADFRHVNLFDRLVRLDFDNELGYSGVVQTDAATEGLSTTAAGPKVATELKIGVPRFPTRAWSLDTTVSFELGVEEAYRFRSAELAPSVSGPVLPWLSLGVGYSLKAYDYLDVQFDEADLEGTEMGLDFTDPYLLSATSQRLILNTRDDPLFTREGYYGTLQVEEAGGLAGGQFNFVRLTTDQRVYRPVRHLLGLNLRNNTVAARLGGGWIVPYGAEDRAVVPYAERLEVGGSTTVRGWTSGHLGPYLCSKDAEQVCSSVPGEAQASKDILPVGGLLSAYGGLDLRYYTDGGYGVAVFTDAGMAWESWQQVRVLPIQPSVGVGARYKSMVGPIRLDLAARLGREPMFALEPRVALHFALAEAF